MQTDIEQKIESWKIMEYGKIARLFRRGVYDLDQAQEHWDRTEYLTKQLLEVATEPVLKKIVTINI